MANKRTNNSPRPTVRAKSIPRKQWRNLKDPSEEKKHIALPSHTELKMLIVFLLFSMAALLFLDHYPMPSDSLHIPLGIAPPLMWIHVAFACYFASEFMLLFIRIRKVNTDRYALKQLLFLTAFFLFYWYAGVLPRYFPLLVSYGILLQLCEAFARKNPIRQSASADS